jgi:hypothetical protein
LTPLRRPVCHSAASLHRFGNTSAVGCQWSTAYLLYRWCCSSGCCSPSSTWLAYSDYAARKPGPPRQTPLQTRTSLGASCDLKFLWIAAMQRRLLPLALPLRARRRMRAPWRLTHSVSMPIRKAFLFVSEHSWAGTASMGAHLRGHSVGKVAVTWSPGIARWIACSRTHGLFRYRRLTCATRFLGGMCDNAQTDVCRGRTMGSPLARLAPALRWM